MVLMNKYYFIVSKIGRNGKIEQKKGWNISLF